MNTENENGANNEVNSEVSATSAPTSETTSTPETVSATSASEAVLSSTAETVSPEVSTEVNSNTVEAAAVDTIDVTFSGVVSGTAKVPRGTALKDAVKAINGKLTGVTFRSAANAVLTKASKLMEAATISTVAKTSMG